MAGQQGTRWPLASNRIRRGRASNTFGEGIRVQTDGSRTNHQGWDFYAPVGTPVYAIHDGVVVRADGVSGAYGNQVVIRLDTVTVNGSQAYAMYGHLSSISVAVNQRVSRGDQIGLTGVSGNGEPDQRLPNWEQDYHLHFEIRDRQDVGQGMGGRVSPATLYGSPPLVNTVIDIPAPPSQTPTTDGSTNAAE